MSFPDFLTESVFRYYAENDITEEFLDYVIQLGFDINSTNKRNIRVKNDTLVLVTGDSLLILACWKNDENTVKWLLEKGADVNIINKIKDTPLIWACNRNNENIVRMLLNLSSFEFKEAADVNIKSKTNNTPLIWACCRNNENIVRMLLEKGADKNIQDKNGKIAIDFCTNDSIKELLKDKKEEVKELLKGILIALEKLV